MSKILVETADPEHALHGQEDLAQEKQGFQSWSFLSWLSLFTAIVCSIYIFSILNWSGNSKLSLLFSDTTPTGGDMGAHVWGPAYLRDYLIPGGSLSGWSTDWYAGFPAYQFYMIIPPLLILALNAGFLFWFAAPLIILLILSVAVLSSSSLLDAFEFPPAFFSIQEKFEQHKRSVWVATVIVSVLCLHVPYGISFKLVSVSGVVLFPLAAWAMGKLARSPEPIPGMLAIAALVFQFDTNFTILGGNILSTLAGEFSFSIALCLVLLATGLIARGIQDNVLRIPAAIVVTLVALSHIIPLFFMVPIFLLVLFAKQANSRLLILSAGVVLCLLAFSVGEQNPGWIFPFAFLTLLVLCAGSLITNKKFRLGFGWLSMVGVLSAGLAAFWLIPFLITGHFHEMFNDMGWERLEEVRENLLTSSMQIALIGAFIGALIAFVKRETIGIVFGFMILISALLVANLGDGSLWNKRLLPFFYLSTYLACAVGLGFVLRLVATDIKGRLAQVNEYRLAVLSATALAASLLLVSVPLHILPFGEKFNRTETNEAGEEETVTVQKLSLLESAKSPIRGWAAWNYSGYEAKDSYADYRNIVLTMDAVGQKYGCGRAMWEFNEDIDQYGTTMAPMLLPFWTDGCIGSMEGLYFESSATTPFHFLNQDALSEKASSAQSHLPYEDFDIDRGVAQLQAMGVRYYMARTDLAVEAARTHPALTEITAERLETGPTNFSHPESYIVFQVAESALVEGLENYPVVISEGRGFNETLDPEALQEQLSTNEQELREALEKRTDRSVSKLIEEQDLLKNQLISFRADPILAVFESNVIENSLNLVSALEVKNRQGISQEEKDLLKNLESLTSSVESHLDDFDGPDEEKEQVENFLEMVEDITKNQEKISDEVRKEENRLQEDLSFELEQLVKKSERESRFKVGWLGEAIKFYKNPLAYDVIPAADGPPEWPRTAADSVYMEDMILPTKDALLENPEVARLVKEVQNPAKIVPGSTKYNNSSLSFSVEEPGTPVLVKTSYYPNWKVEGAEGPWRAGANQMIVVPTETEVTLSYGRSGVDWLATFISLAALGGLIALATSERRKKLLESSALVAAESEPPILVAADDLEDGVEPSFSAEAVTEISPLITFEDLTDQSASTPASSTLVYVEDPENKGAVDDSKKG